ncbi:MAG: S8 family serine peptidase [Propionibacteriaceae bacterium]|jgi:subtilisin family serine protease|nr:S8 family serine peptidase [Propionibacteriaceae bacterium]
MMLAEQAVADAGGVVVQAWPQIGVVIAHSASVTFEADVVKAAKGGSVVSVGLTRTIPVAEGTPAGSGVTGNGATGKGQQSLPGETAETVVPDPGETTSQWDMRLILADQAHAITDGSPDVLVGVLDSGIDGDHPELAGQINRAASVNCTNAGAPDTSARGWYPSNSTHGTHVAGTIAAARNGVGIVGVAPGVKLASIKVVNDAGSIYPEYAICGFVWAAEHGVDVTNNSYFIDPFEYWCDDQPDQAAVKEAVRRAVDYASAKGIIHVAAAGNSRTDLTNNTTDTGSPNDSAPVSRIINSGCQNIPTELDGVVTVSSITSTSALASSSNRGLGIIDVAAPGNGIYSTLPLTMTNGYKNTVGYGSMSGTSMASPHVAGVLALMKSVHPGWTPAQMETAIRAEATDTACPAAAVPAGSAACVGTTANNSYYGEGIVNALAAVQP